jgi:DNA-directed RNA polymerase specialized sigma24 family protein
LVPANRYATALPNDRLHALVTRIAGGDRAAFRTLYAFLAMRVWHDAIRRLPPVDARAVTRSTFVEIWHLAGHHLDHGGRETRAWVQSILAGHVDDRIRTGGVRPLTDGHDQRKQHELTALLGNGHATVRTAAATFTRVDDLAPLPPSPASGPGWPVPVR